MQLTLWTYEGPPHVGAMRVATAMQGVHYVLHAPQGDTYADLLFTMIERRDRAPAGHLHHLPGARPGRRHRRAVQDRRARRLRALPAAGDDRRRLLHRRADPGRPGRPGRGAGPAGPGHAAGAAGLPAQGKLGRGRDLLPAGARSCADDAARAARAREPASRAALQHARARPRWASATATTCARSRGLLGELGIDVNVVAPLGATPGRPRPPGRGRLQRRALPRDRACRPRRWLQRTFGQPLTKTVPIGVGATRDFIAEVAALAGVDAAAGAGRRRARARPGTRARSTRPTSPASASSSSATPPMPSPPRASPREELGFEVVGLGTYSREFAREVRDAAKALRRRGADHRRLPRGRGRDRRAAARAGAGHADGAPHRQAPGHPLRGDLGARCTCRTSRRATRRRWASKAPT